MISIGLPISKIGNFLGILTNYMLEEANSI